MGSEENLVTAGTSLKFCTVNQQKIITIIIMPVPVAARSKA